MPFPNPGMMRAVYPGFLQLTGFMTMNLDRHVGAHRDMFMHLVRGDGDSAQKHREFYDEYLSVMDLTAEFYLQTVDTVFVQHALPLGQMMHRDERVDPSKIRNVALMTVEGENDDISGVGQTEATHRLCTNLPASKKLHYLQREVGHYGVFNGSRFRHEIVPRIAAFMRKHDGKVDEGASTKATARERSSPAPLAHGAQPQGQRLTGRIIRSRIRRIAPVKSSTLHASLETCSDARLIGPLFVRFGGLGNVAGARPESRLQVNDSLRPQYCTDGKLNPFSSFRAY